MTEFLTPNHINSIFFQKPSHTKWFSMFLCKYAISEIKAAKRVRQIFQNPISTCWDQKTCFTLITFLTLFRFNFLSFTFHINYRINSVRIKKNTKYLASRIFLQIEFSLFSLGHKQKKLDWNAMSEVFFLMRVLIII